MNVENESVYHKHKDRSRKIGGDCNRQAEEDGGLAQGHLLGKREKWVHSRSLFFFFWSTL